MLKSAKPELFEEGLAWEKLLPRVPHKWVGGRTGERIAAAKKADVNPTDPQETECFVWVIS